LAESFFTTSTSSFLEALNGFYIFSGTGTSLTLFPLVCLFSGTTTTLSTFFAAFSYFIGATFSF
jgi:hypothetical protein